MKQLQILGKSLSKEEMKQVRGGYFKDTCNNYCGQGSGQTCSGTCGSCVDAGNGAGSGPGQDKLCAR